MFSPIDPRHPALPALFDESVPNGPILFALLGGRLPGRAIADDPERPSVAAVQTAEGVAFISHGAGQRSLDDALTTLRADSMVGLVWAESMAGSVTPAVPAKVVERLGFEALSPSAPSMAALRARLPADVSVRAIDAELLARCEWQELVVGAHGGVEAFLRDAFGLCLMRGNDILSEAYAPFVGRTIAEVGVVTPEAHRGHGLAAVAIAFLAERVGDRGLSMYWSCDADNLASVRVAEKSGFGAAQPFQMLLYRPLQA